LELGRPDELDRLEAVVLVELVLAAVEERNDLALVVAGALALAFDAFDLRFYRACDLRGTRAGRCCTAHTCGHVVDRNELIEVEAGAERFVLAARRVETLLHVIRPARRLCLDTFARAVMVRHHQPVRRDERARAARADARPDERA